MSDFFRIFLTASAFLAIFQLIGFGFSRLVFKYSAELAVFLSAAFGLAYTGTLAWWCYVCGYRLSSGVAWAIVLPASALSIALFLHDRRLHRLTYVLTKRWLVFMGVCLPVLGVSVLPLCVQHGAWVLSLWNLDIVRHSTISRFLQEQSLLSLQGYVAQNPYDFVWFASNTYFGYYSIVATIASLFRTLPHEVVSATLCFISSLGSTLFFLFARRVFRIPLRASIGWSWLVGANALALFVLYHGWGGQIFGSCFAVGFLYLGVRTPLAALPATFSSRRAAGLGVMLLGLALCYQHMLPVVVGLVLAWRLCEAGSAGIGKFSWRPLAAEIACALLAALALAPQRAEAVLLWTAEAATNKSGWPVRFLWPDYWLGLIGPQMHFTDVGAASSGLRLVALVGLGLLVVAASRYRRNSWSGPFVPLLATLGLIYVFALLLSSLEPGPFFGTYKSFKLLSFFLLLPGLLIAVCWYTLYGRTSGIKYFALLALGGFLAAWTFGVRAIVHGDKRTELLRQEDVAALKQLSDEVSFSSVNIDTEDRWQSMWLTYFFLSKSVFLANPSYYPASGKLAGEVGFFNPGPTARDLFLYNNRKPFRTTMGATFVDHREQVYARLGRGWYEGETTLAWMGQTGTTAEIEVYPSLNAQSLIATIHLTPFLTDNECSLEWNGRNVVQFSPKSELTVRLTDWQPGRNILRLRSKLPPQRPNNGDQRLIAFGITMIEFSTVYK